MPINIGPKSGNFLDLRTSSTTLCKRWVNFDFSDDLDRSAEAWQISLAAQLCYPTGAAAAAFGYVCYALCGMSFVLMTEINTFATGKPS
jgi:hypothetical protein